jgi:hypothetical protein
LLRRRLLAIPRSCATGNAIALPPRDLGRTKRVYVTNRKAMVTTSTEEVINVIAWNIREGFPLHIVAVVFAQAVIFGNFNHGISTKW